MLNNRRAKGKGMRRWTVVTRAARSFELDSSWEARWIDLSFDARKARAREKEETRGGKIRVSSSSLLVASRSTHANGKTNRVCRVGRLRCEILASRTCRQ